MRILPVLDRVEAASRHAAKDSQLEEVDTPYSFAAAPGESALDFSAVTTIDVIFCASRSRIQHLMRCLEAASFRSCVKPRNIPWLDMSCCLSLAKGVP